MHHHQPSGQMQGRERCEAPFRFFRGRWCFREDNTFYPDRALTSSLPDTEPDNRLAIHTASDLIALRFNDKSGPFLAKDEVCGISENK